MFLPTLLLPFVFLKPKLADEVGGFLTFFSSPFILSLLASHFSEGNKLSKYISEGFQKCLEKRELS